MLKLAHSTMIFISGAVWFVVGTFLLQMGLKLLFAAAGTVTQSAPFLHLFQSVLPAQEAAIALTALALYIGFLKGRHVLTKTANRTIEHIRSLPNPADIQKMYTRKYYILLGGMMLLGMCFKYLGFPDDVRGVIDIVVGSALIHGAMHYFRVAIEARKISVS